MATAMGPVVELRRTTALSSPLSYLVCFPPRRRRVSASTSRRVLTRAVISTTPTPAPAKTIAVCKEEQDKGFNDKVGEGTPKQRLDAWLSSRMEGISRARIQSSVRQGLVHVNGTSINKTSHIIRAGDIISCNIVPLVPLRAEPEEMHLDIVHEDDDVIIVNKPAHMVVHPAPGNPNGTLVNGILHHCGLPSIGCADLANGSDSEGDDGDEVNMPLLDCSLESAVRPGIVHRIDKGTSGLLVIAKNENAHACLAEQFEKHTVFRKYVSLTCGVPAERDGRIEMSIARDPNNRVRMKAVPSSNTRYQARFAASRYSVTKELCKGGVGVVEWRLETGRTHQIRVHAQHIGFPLLGDEIYGGTKGLALSRLKCKLPSKYHGEISKVISSIERPCLHAYSLGFEHPRTGEKVLFSCPPPQDFMDVLNYLRKLKGVC